MKPTAPTPPTMLARRVEDLRIFVIGAGPPTDVEWDAHIAHVRAEASSPYGILVASDGGTPTTQQRARLAALEGALRPPTAVLTSSPVVRGVMTVMSWLGGNLRAFAPDAVDSALEHLRVPSAHRPVVVATLETLRRRVRGGPRAS